LSLLQNVTPRTRTTNPPLFRYVASLAMLAAEEELSPVLPLEVTAFTTSRLSSQARLLAARLPPLALERYSSLSPSAKTALSLCLGALGCWAISRLIGSAFSLGHHRAHRESSSRPRRRLRTLSEEGGGGGGRVRTYSDQWRSESSEVSVVSRPHYNWGELQKNSVSDQESVVSNATLVDGTHLAPQQLGLMGLEALETVIGYWEDALGAYNPTANSRTLTTSDETRFIRAIEELLETGYDLQESAEMLFIHQNSVLNKRQEAAAEEKAAQLPSLTASCEGRSRSGRLSMSTLDEVSFVSAEETVADLRDFDDLSGSPEVCIEALALYQAALDHHEAVGIKYRVMRTDFVGCASDLEYLAKLHCLRKAFTHIMKDPDNRLWWVDNGRLILTQLLVKAGKEPKEFVLAFDDMLDFLTEEGWEEQIQEELKSRNVQSVNFFDICLDYILIDSFEDLETPPSSVLAVMKNRWLSNSFKESALHTAIWSVFQAKRRLLQFPNGFKARFYNVSEILTPSLAWAFFGPDEGLCQLVNQFKEQVIGFLQDIFSFSQVDFSDVLSLSESIMRLGRARLEVVKERLQCDTEGGEGEEL